MPLFSSICLGVFSGQAQQGLSASFPSIFKLLITVPVF